MPTSFNPIQLTLRTVKNQPLTFIEGDNNLSSIKYFCDDAKIAINNTEQQIDALQQNEKIGRQIPHRTHHSLSPHHLIDHDRKRNHHHQRNHTGKNRPYIQPRNQRRQNPRLGNDRPLRQNPKCRNPNGHSHQNHQHQGKKSVIF